MEIHYLNSIKEDKKKLLRITLKGLEHQLDSRFFVRSHRFFIVNISHISEIKGNTKGMEISMMNRISIPVARSKVNLLRRTIHGLNN